VAIIAEPTLLDVVVAHKGTCRWKCHTRGRAAHSSQPQLGDNAIYKMARVVAAFESYAREAQTSNRSHPLCGRPTLSVGTILGGLSVNTVPDHCTIEIDRRVLPGEQASDVYHEVIEYVARQPGINFPLEHEPAFLRGPSLSDTHNGPLADRLVTVTRRLLGRGEKIGVPYGTDAATIAGAGVPSVVFGPGSIDQAHTADEWLAIAQLTKASDVLYEFARSGG
jgi:acetylornithine deacetylase